MRTACIVFLVVFAAHPANYRVGALAAQDDKEAPWLPLVKEANEDFDRFINGLLESVREDPEAFQEAARAARALNNLLVKNSIQEIGTKDSDPSKSLFHDFARYVAARKPVSIRGVVKGNDFNDKPCLARCTSLSADELDELWDSIVLSRGNVEVGKCFGSLIVSGGDVNCKKRMGGCMIIAAGDVNLNSRGGIMSSNSLIIAGGTVTLNDGAAFLVIVSPKKVRLAETAQVFKQVVMIHGSAKPKDLFKFPSLANYGVAARLEKGQIQILNTAKFFRKGDVILKRKDDKIESLGQFRRLLAHSLKTGEIDFEVERAGKTLRITQKLTKE